MTIGAAGYWSRGESLPNALGIEILAQAAARLFATETTGERIDRMMVGVEAAEFASPGLAVGVVWARFEPPVARGGLIKARGELLSAEGTVLAGATLLLAG